MKTTSYVPKGHWKSESNQRQFLDELFKKLKLKTWEDWYKITGHEFRRNGKFECTFYKKTGGGCLLQRHGSVQSCLTKLYPEHTWILWKFKKAQKGIWTTEMKRYAFELARKELGLNSLDDWYTVKYDEWRRLHHFKFIPQQEISLSPHLISLFPDHDWKPWRFPKFNQETFNNKNNQRRYILDLGKKLGFRDMEDYYQLKQKHFLGGPCSRILRLNRYSIYSVMKSNFPHYDWKPWKFLKCPIFYFESPQNQKNFLLNFAKDKGINEPKDWYSVRATELKIYGGSHLLRKKSLSSLLQTHFPEEKWEPWKFARLPSRFWQKKDNVTRYVESFANSFEITSLDSWKFVTVKQFLSHGGSSILIHFKSLADVLAAVYPEGFNTNLDLRISKSIPIKTEKMVHSLLLAIFPNEKDVLMHFVHPELKNVTGASFILDAFIPSLNLAFEYQGEQHYSEGKLFGSFKKLKIQDNEKRKECERKNITLIEIPFWSNLSKRSLIEMIKAKRPELFNNQNTTK